MMFTYFFMSFMCGAVLFMMYVCVVVVVSGRN